MQKRLGERDPVYHPGHPLRAASKDVSALPAGFGAALQKSVDFAGVSADIKGVSAAAPSEPIVVDSLGLGVSASAGSTDSKGVALPKPVSGAAVVVDTPANTVNPPLKVTSAVQGDPLVTPSTALPQVLPLPDGPFNPSLLPPRTQQVTNPTPIPFAAPFNRTANIDPFSAQSGLSRDLPATSSAPHSALGQIPLNRQKTGKGHLKWHTSVNEGVSGMEAGESDLDSQDGDADTASNYSQSDPLDSAVAAIDAKVDGLIAAIAQLGGLVSDIHHVLRVLTSKPR